MKWEPVALMILLILLGAWLVGGPGRQGEPVRIGPLRGNLVINRDAPDAWTYTIQFRDKGESRTFTQPELREILGDSAMDQLIGSEGNALFKLLNITGWGGLIWVAIGFGGQIAFFGRMTVQWVVSERKRQSVVPEIFWWLSFFGGVCLFTYFVWRQDLVGVLGQSTGVVIYARNIRLIHKQHRRERRAAERHAASGGGDTGEGGGGEAGSGPESESESPYADPAPEPMDRPS